MTTDENSFLATIFERPTEDGPRVVYADWLEDQGEAERAELIRVQIALLRGFIWKNGIARPLSDQEWIDMPLRSAQLEDLHIDKWFAATPEILEILLRDPERITSGNGGPLRNCERITWDRGFIRDINLSRMDIPTFPGNVHVIGNLDLSNTRIRTLPDDLRVGRNLDLRYAHLTVLPKNLYVGRDLNLSQSRTITTLPDNLHVPGTLDLSYTRIDHLPTDLRVDGSLYLSRRQITEEHARDLLDMPGLSDEAKINGLHTAGFENLAEQAERRAAQAQAEGRA